MRTAIGLGLRLAVGTRGQRTRSVLVVTASAVGTVVMLLVWGIAHSQVAPSTVLAFDRNAANLLMAGTIALVGLPVLVFVATIARLSARVRDHRLGNLRLLGLSAAQTRWVAATEVGVTSLVGALAGATTFALVAPIIPGFEVAGRNLAVDSLTPPVLGWVCVLLAILVTAVLTAGLPQRLATDRVLSEVREGESQQFRLILVVPLVAGFLLCWATRSPLLDRDDTVTTAEIVMIFAGVALLGIGILLVVPVFATLIAGLILRWGRGPLATLVGRRLQTQPAGATRVIAVLMVGLFVVVGARGVLTAFLSTPQYLHAAAFVERNQTAETSAAPDEAEGTVETLRAVEGVGRVRSFPMLHASSAEPTDLRDFTANVVVASCDDLAGDVGLLAGCSDTTASLVGAHDWQWVTDAGAVRVQSMTGFASHGEAVTVSMAGAGYIDFAEFERAFGALTDTAIIVLPPDAPGLAELVEVTDRIVVAEAGPGRFLYDRVEQAGVPVISWVDLETYDFVQGMLMLVATLAVVVLSIGLLTFTIAGVDRALSRRRELTSLRLIGTPGWILRAAQWCEVAIPAALGSLLAIVAGGYAGATYLQLDGGRFMPLTTAFTLAVAATAASMVLAWITTLGTTSRLDPEHIRSQ